LYSIEIPEVKRGLKLRLQELCEAKEDREAAEIAFRALYRFSRDELGRQVPGVQLGYAAVLRLHVS